MAVYTVFSLVFPAKETFLSQDQFDEQQNECDLEVRLEGSDGTEKEKLDIESRAHRA